MLTDTQLASAIRSLGATGEPFSSAALRAHLGMTTQDRRALTRFNDALRHYSKVNSHMLERVGKNRYRLLKCDPAVVDEEERPRLPRRVVIRITRTPVRVAAPAPPEPRFWWQSVFARFASQATQRTS
jgi:hypothetical protein